MFKEDCKDFIDRLVNTNAMNIQRCLVLNCLYVPPILSSLSRLQLITLPLKLSHNFETVSLNCLVSSSAFPFFPLKTQTRIPLAALKKNFSSSDHLLIL